MLDTEEDLAQALQILPPVEFAFAYGSGVFQQPGTSFSSSPPEALMVDYILDKIGVGIHFNAFVPWNGKMIKYGVIGMQKLVQDMLTWRWLYISGRLQKPVYILVDNWDLSKVNQVNLCAAVVAALLLLPAKFSEEDLYTQICGLSYMGDVRMLFAEDKHKVQKIVQGSEKNFHELYRTPLRHLAASGLLELPTSGHLGSLLTKDCSPCAVGSLLSSLPCTILQKMSYDTSHLASQIAGKESILKGDPSKSLQKAIRSVVRASSIRQMLSGFLAAGSGNAVRYFLEKAGKAWRSRF